MRDFAGKIAVITGGGTGMGRELARQLVAEGCNVAMCDVPADAMAETKRLCEVETLPQGLRITTHIADVSIEDQLLRFRDEINDQQATDKIHLLFNNAVIGGGGSLFTSTREQWEKTFNICWGGVYLGVRTFLPMLQKADEGHIVDTSSVNGFWATVGPGVSHTAYSAAKFAVKGFTEALINDLRLNAPHIKCSVVMPGHIGTPIVSTSACGRRRSGPMIRSFFRALPPRSAGGWVSVPSRSDRLDAGFGDDVTPLRHFVVDALAHAVGPVGEDLKAVVAQLLRDRRPLGDFDRLGRQHLDNGRWRFRRRQKTLEGVGDKILVAEFDHGRHVLQIEPAMDAGHGQRLQRAGLDVRMRRR